MLRWSENAETAGRGCRCLRFGASPCGACVPGFAAPQLIERSEMGFWISGIGGTAVLSLCFRRASEEMNKYDRGVWFCVELEVYRGVWSRVAIGIVRLRILRHGVRILWSEGGSRSEIFPISFRCCGATHVLT